MNLLFAFVFSFKPNLEIPHHQSIPSQNVLVDQMKRGYLAFQMASDFLISNWIYLLSCGSEINCCDGGLFLY